jgi:hypothetical protein
LNILVVAGLIFSVLMVLLAISRISVVYFGNKRWTGRGGTELNSATIVVFGTATYWLTTLL